MRLRRRLLVVAIAGTILGGSGWAAAAAAATRGTSSAAGPHLPSTILGLTVQRENVSKKLASEKGALYVDRVSFFSLREPSKLLEATVEYARFTASAPLTSDFERSIVLQFGGQLPTVVQVGDQAVFVTTVRGLIVPVWFRHGYMVVLSIRNAYAQPKALLRTVLDVSP